MPGLPARLAVHEQALLLLRESPELYAEQQAQSMLAEAKRASAAAAQSAGAEIIAPSYILLIYPCIIVVIQG